MNIIEDIAADNAVAWGTIAQKIDENFAEVEGALGNINTNLETIIAG